MIFFICFGDLALLMGRSEEREKFGSSQEDQG